MRKRTQKDFDVEKEWGRITDLTRKFSKIPKNRKAKTMGDTLLFAQVLLEKIQLEQNNKESDKALYLHISDRISDYVAKEVEK